MIYHPTTSKHIAFHLWYFYCTKFTLHAIINSHWIYFYNFLSQQVINIYERHELHIRNTCRPRTNERNSECAIVWYEDSVYMHSTPDISTLSRMACSGLQHELGESKRNQSGPREPFRMNTWEYCPHTVCYVWLRTASLSRSRGARNTKMPRTKILGITGSNSPPSTRSFIE